MEQFIGQTEINDFSRHGPSTEKAQTPEWSNNMKEQAVTMPHQAVTAKRKAQGHRWETLIQGALDFRGGGK